MAGRGVNSMRLEHVVKERQIEVPPDSQPAGQPTPRPTPT